MSKNYNMDPDPRSPWSFLPIYDRYWRCAICVCLADAAGFFVTRGTVAAEWFVASIALLLSFLMLLLLFYEGYIHGKFAGEPRYTETEYTIVRVLGSAGMVTFLGAVGLMLLRI